MHPLSSDWLGLGAGSGIFQQQVALTGIAGERRGALELRASFLPPA